MGTRTSQTIYRSLVFLYLTAVKDFLVFTRAAGAFAGFPVALERRSLDDNDTAEPGGSEPAAGNGVVDGLATSYSQLGGCFGDSKMIGEGITVGFLWGLSRCQNRRHSSIDWTIIKEFFLVSARRHPDAVKNAMAGYEHLPMKGDIKEIFMTDDEIRLKVKEKLKMGTLSQPDIVEIGYFSAGGSQCSVCEGDKPDYTHTDHLGSQTSFHKRCWDIFVEECNKPIPN